MEIKLLVIAEDQKTAMKKFAKKLDSFQTQIPRIPVDIELPTGIVIGGPSTADDPATEWQLSCGVFKTE